MKRRIGLLGGTFDPPHWAHLVLAETAREELSLDEVWFLPAGRPPHKLSRRLTPPAVRLAMLRAAIAGNRAFRVEPLELSRPGKSFTADTLETLAGERPEVEWWLLVGGDMLADLPHWRRPRRVLELARLAVAARPGHPLAAPRGLGRRVRRLGAPPVALSSTEIRRRVAAGRSIRYLVPEAVARIIRRRGLYRKPGGSP